MEEDSCGNGVAVLLLLREGDDLGVGELAGLQRLVALLGEGYFVSQRRRRWQEVGRVYLGGVGAGEDGGGDGDGVAVLLLWREGDDLGVGELAGLQCVVALLGKGYFVSQRRRR